MKFVHLGDLHLGKNVNAFSMLEDQKYILKQILSIVEEENADAVLAAGDIYDRSVPSEEAVRLFDWFLTSLRDMGKKVFVISGNHDSDVRLGFGSDIFRKDQIYIQGEYQGTVPCVDVEDQYGPVHVYMMPYVKASHVSHFFPEEEISGYDQAFRVAMRSCNVNTDERNIILAHQFVTGHGQAPEMDGSEMEVLNVGTIDMIGCDCFDDFDYVALGHIHGCQQVGRETCRYAGSPLKYSLNEREMNSVKTVPVVEMKEKGSVDVKLVPLHALRQLRHVKGRLQEILDNATDCDDYIYVTLTDEQTQLDAMARIREVYPNTMKLDYDNQQTRAVFDREDLDTADKSFQELITGFFHLINGREPSEEEMTLLNEVAEEAEIVQ